MLDLRAADGFQLTVVEGPKKGYSWLVDPLFVNAKIRKFSGTTQAGSNTGDLVGRTCDVFAHFSFFDSEATVVFVDIMCVFMFLISLSILTLTERQALTQIPFP